MGYFGIQELTNGRKLVIFSVWDPGKQDDPNIVEEDRRVRIPHPGEGVRVGRFSIEGTGTQSFNNLDWPEGSTYRFLVTASPDGPRTAFSAYVVPGEDGDWFHLATFATLADGALLRGNYAFVEDFQRNRVSATQTRRASYGPGWLQRRDRTWEPLRSARFTADLNPVTKIDAGTAGDRFFLATGGDVENCNTPLRQVISVEFGEAQPATLPPGFASAP